MLFLYGFLLGTSACWLTFLIRYYFVKRALNDRIIEAKKLIAEEDIRIKAENDRIMERIERLNLKNGKNEPTIN